MNGEGRGARAGRAAALVVILSLGVCLRLVHLMDWPPGPWIDEVYFLRAARIAAAAPFALFSTTPMHPPEFAFENDFRFYPSNLVLYGIAGLDRLAGGGLRSVRLVSSLLSLLVLFASVALAREATRGRPFAFLPAAFLLATSVWLLTQGRWAWDHQATSTVATFSAALALAAFRHRSGRLAVLAGLVLGLGPYAHASGRLVFLAPAAVFGWALARRRREEARLSALVFAGALLVASPLLLEWARHPERFRAHVADISILSRGAGQAPRALLENVRDYAALFFLRGDPIERHGDPSRPIVLTGVALFLTAGAAAGVRRAGVERLLLVSAAVFLVGGLLARDTNAANASRISPAAPFLLVLAALGADVLVARVSNRVGPVAWALVWGVVAVCGSLDAAAFIHWATSPRAEVGFGAPERRLAARLAAERTAAPAEILLHPQRAARNVYFVDVLLGTPGDGGRHVVRVGTPGLDGSWLRRPEADVLYAADGGQSTREGVARLSGREIARDDGPEVSPAWVLYRIPREAARAAADSFLSALPPVPAAGGAFEAPEGGLFVFEARGPVSVRLGNRVVLDSAGRAAGGAVLHLAKGRHPLVVTARSAEARLRITGPDGFALPAAGLTPP